MMMLSQVPPPRLMQCECDKALLGNIQPGRSNASVGRSSCPIVAFTRVDSDGKHDDSDGDSDSSRTFFLCRMGPGVVCARPLTTNGYAWSAGHASLFGVVRQLR